jgi:GNAT superfamily N-acetyltransferase
LPVSQQVTIFIFAADKMQVTRQSAVTIRTLLPGEQHFLREMIYYAMYIPEDQDRPGIDVVDHPAISKYFRGWGRHGDTALVAVSGKKLVGAAWYRLFTPDNPGYGFINAYTPEISIAFRPDYRNQGLGSQLLLRLLRIAAAEGYNSVSLSVDVRNAALRLYERIGFFEIEREGFVSLMQCRLFPQMDEN